MNIFNNTFEPYIYDPDVEDPSQAKALKLGSPTKQEQCDEKFKIISGEAYWGNEFHCCQYNCRRIQD